jgi:hypothetical protein
MKPQCVEWMPYWVDCRLEGTVLVPAGSAYDCCCHVRLEMLITNLRLQQVASRVAHGILVANPSHMVEVSILVVRGFLWVEKSGIWSFVELC